MIKYHLLDGDIYIREATLRPKTCFLMVKLGREAPPIVSTIKNHFTRYVNDHGFQVLDANDVVTGRDFLMKIWDIILSVPMGVAIITEEYTTTTMSNIFYELGLLQACGKETLIIKNRDCPIPSDFIRTEYIEYPHRLGDFKGRIDKFLKSYSERANYYLKMAMQLDTNVFYKLDYLKRNYLMTGSESTYEMIDFEVDNFLKEWGIKGKLRDTLKLALAKH